MRKPLILTFYLLLFVIRLSAQQGQLVFNRISTKEGLASNHVYSIVQDKKGFMWFGTANGLQRYDGRKIINFRFPQHERNYLPTGAINQIFQDKTGNFWLRSGKEVGIFDPTTFKYTRAEIRVSHEIAGKSDFLLIPDSRGNVFLLLKKYGILSYDNSKNEFSNEFIPIHIPPGWLVTHFTEDPVTKDYWLGADSGLAIYSHSKKKLYHRHNNPEKLKILENPQFHYIAGLYVDRTARAWIVTWKGGDSARYYCYDLTRNQLTEDSKGLGTSVNTYHELHEYFQQQNGRMWAYGRMFLYRKYQERGPFQYIRDLHIDDYGIRYDIVHNMFEDREHSVWLATDQGIYILNMEAQPFKSISGRSNRFDGESQSITSFTELPNGELWAGSWGKGVFTFDSSFQSVPNSITAAGVKKDASYKLVWSLLTEKNKKRVWIGCQAGRLIVYDVRTKQSIFLKPAVFHSRTIRQIVEDGNGNIWFGTHYGQLIKWTPKNNPVSESDFELVTHFNSVIYKLYIDKEGRLWAGVGVNGLYCIDPVSGKTIYQFSSKGERGKSLYSEIPSDIVQYNDSLFFVATSALNVLNINTGRIEHLTHDLTLESPAINSLSLDASGALWLGTLNGLTRYNPIKRNFTHFGPRDGIMNNNFQPGAAYARRNGQLLFGNTHDFVVFNPSEAGKSKVPPDVNITDFKLFNTYIPPDSILKLDKVRLDANQNSITIEFAALTYLEKDKIVYHFKMQGIDKAWNRVDRFPIANYTLLPPGEYTFLVKCENADGISSRNTTSLRIYIQPPFWQTSWFFLLALLALAGIVYFVHRLRVNRILDMQKVRTRIARDLHDDMGSTLSTINILSEMAKMKVHQDASKTNEYLHKISDNSSRMMEAMDDIVWSINPLNDSMSKITARMREFATGVLEAKNIDFTFHVDDEVKDLKLDMEARRDFFLLFKEAVNNLAKYSNCKRATIDITVRKSKLFMNIRDDGQGFDVGAADSGNGLTNMKKRAQSLKGLLDIISSHQAGTHVALEVPLQA